MKLEVNENTRIPLGMAVTCLVFICGLIVLAVRVESKGNYTEARVQKLEEKQERYSDDIAIVKSDLRLIKKQMKIDD